MDNKNKYFNLQKILDNPEKYLDAVIEVFEAKIHEVEVGYKDRMKENFVIKFPKNVTDIMISSIMKDIIVWAKDRKNISLLEIDHINHKKDFNNNGTLCVPKRIMECQYFITLEHEDGTKIDIIYRCTNDMYLGEVAKLFTNRALPFGKLKQVFIKAVD